MLTKRSWPLSLRVLDLFSEASPAELRTIGTLVTMLSVDAGTVLINEGGIGMEFMVILDGQADVTVAGQHVATLGAGDFVGEMSLLARDPRSATVTASTPLTFYVSNTAEFASLLDIPSVARKIRAAASERAAVNEAQRAA